MLMELRGSGPANEASGVVKQPRLLRDSLRAISAVSGLPAHVPHRPASPGFLCHVPPGSMFIVRRFGEENGVL